jgi:hypothetical protein
MKADFEFTADDLVAFVTFHSTRSPTVRRQRLICATLGFLFLSAIPALILITTDKPRVETAHAIWPLLLGPVLFTAFLTRFWKRSLGQTSRRMIAEGESTGYFGPCSLSIVPDGILETKPSGQTHRRWAVIKRIIVADHHVFVYTSAVEAFILPKRAFDGDHQCQEFVDQLAQLASVVPEIT